MPIWLIKTILTLIMVVADIVVGVQIFDYWFGLAYFPIISTAILAAVHLAIIAALVYFHIAIFKIKKV